MACPSTSAHQPAPSPTLQQHLAQLLYGTEIFCLSDCLFCGPVSLHQASIMPYSILCAWHLAVWHLVGTENSVGLHLTRTCWICCNLSLPGIAFQHFSYCGQCSFSLAQLLPAVFLRLIFIRSRHHHAPTPAVLRCCCSSPTHLYFFVSEFMIYAACRIWLIDFIIWNCLL